MELDIDLVAYMWVLGMLIVLVAVAGYFVVGTTLREHNRRREQAMAGSTSHYPWDVDHPDSFGQR
jgi:hypothetical protein